MLHEGVHIKYAPQPLSVPLDSVSLFVSSLVRIHITRHKRLPLQIDTSSGLSRASASANMTSVGTEHAIEAAAADLKGVTLADEKTGLDGRRSEHDSEAETVVPPTDEELHTLRRIPAPIPWICFTIAFVELCERFAYYGTTAVSKYSSLSGL